jgi:anti-sigma factor RsiW
MRTSLNDIAHTEKYLQGRLSPEERLVFEARLLTSPLLRWNVSTQQKVYTLLKLYHRKKMKQQVKTVQDKLFHDAQHAEWKKEILQLFK